MKNFNFFLLTMKKFLSLFAVFLVLPSASAGFECNSLEKAQTFYEQENYDIAQNCAENYLFNNPTDPEVHKILAEIYQGKGLYRKAESSRFIFAKYTLKQGKNFSSPPDIGLGVDKTLELIEEIKKYKDSNPETAVRLIQVVFDEFKDLLGGLKQDQAFNVYEKIAQTNIGFTEKIISLYINNAMEHASTGRNRFSNAFSHRALTLTTAFSIQALKIAEKYGTENNLELAAKEILTIADLMKPHHLELRSLASKYINIQDSELYFPLKKGNQVKMITSSGNNYIFTCNGEDEHKGQRTTSITSEFLKVKHIAHYIRNDDGVFLYAEKPYGDSETEKLEEIELLMPSDLKTEPKNWVQTLNIEGKKFPMVVSVNKTNETLETRIGNFENCICLFGESKIKSGSLEGVIRRDVWYAPFIGMVKFSQRASGNFPDSYNFDIEITSFKDGK